MVLEHGERAEQREQTALRIVEAAGIVIDRDGYAGASIPEILRTAAVSRGGFYHHFDSKKAVGNAVLERQHEFFERVAQQGAAGPVPVYWSQVLIDVSYEYTTGILDDPVLRAAVRLSIEPGPYLTQESYRSPLGAVTSILTAARDAGELQDHVLPEETARTLVGCYSGVQLLALALEERDQLYGQVAGMWRLLMPGLASPTVLGRLRLDRPPQT
ncbi:TetR/AcrR family transcriptional regulator [Streptomyces sp. OUCMDZ-4982]|uniref:TetR/AcrR family transcriptional regulator n=1 Tax=Streptomyces sp. OUCMDZ-4982 TaxID=2973090 RepID=UPI00215BFAB1|nr:TetR/AcrR family transcriptional regulator [Streptomyces sp. OUCMDZ-4982]MCR8945067.1 TetR/AcrR family transcriptional regulator [Streptomyces sp. OUCMDZ-4982]